MLKNQMGSCNFTIYNRHTSLIKILLNPIDIDKMINNITTHNTQALISTNIINHNNHIKPLAASLLLGTVLLACTSNNNTSNLTEAVTPLLPLI